jgi:MFS family permease
MPRISIKAIVIAFATELLADLLIQATVFPFFAGDLLAQDLSQEELQKVFHTVSDTTAYVPWMMVLGTATTVGGAYLAARLAKRIPYYHGLAMGIVGVIWILFAAAGSFGWLDALGLLITVPAALYGAHLAKKHMPSES